ncbi:MAG: HEAT repeat domain-containing protein [Chloroflexi bacterium]|nr:HEAT repeat domain-containing protein [Chloroflexota bacterium]
MRRVSVQHLFFTSIVLFLTILACDGRFKTPPPAPTVIIPTTVEELAIALSDPNYAVRSRAAKALGEMGPKSAPAVPALAIALSDPRYEMRLFTAEALSKVGPAAALALPEIITTLRSNNRGQEEPHLIITLGNIGPAAKSAVPLLIEILEHENNDFTRSLAAESLGKINDPEALPTLVKVLEAEKGIIFDVREEAARAVANFDEQARFAVPVLAKLLDDENRYAASLSACAIAKITGEAFPNSEDDCEGFTIAESGESYIVIVAREWWEKEGQFQDWDNP